LSIVNFDRVFFAFSIGSHIILVVISMVLALLVSIVELLAIRRNDELYEKISRRLAKTLIIIFAIGTASGTLIAVELFALFPGFMSVVGYVSILPFYSEVFAFFLEAIALVMYVYFWDRFKNRYSHWLLSVMVVVGTAASAIFITMINAWMNTPVGFNIHAYLATGVLTGINPWAVFNAPSTWSEEFHVVTTTYAAGGFLMIAFFSYFYLKGKGVARVASKALLKISTAISGFFIVLAGLSGTLTASMLIVEQPLKYAAIELNLHSSANAAETIGGIFSHGKILDAITIPHLQSLLAFPLTLGKGTVPGLNLFPNQSLWPPLFIHLTFDVMVLGGTLIGLFAFFVILGYLLHKDPYTHRFVVAGGIISGVLGLLVYESGWVTDEVGRQPWIIYNVMKVSQAANTSPSIVPLGIAMIIFYLVAIPFTIYYTAKTVNFREFNDEPTDEKRGGEVNVPGR